MGSASFAAAGAGCLGREAELALIGQLLDDATPSPHAVILEGEPGIGKTTVWAAGIADAVRRGYHTLSTRGSQSETGLSFAGLTDLLDDVVDDVLPALPEPRRVALEIALLRRLPGEVPLGRREVGAAVHAVLRRLCAERRVLLAIDDLALVDRATLDAVAFACRRMHTEPLRLLGTRRVAGGMERDESRWPVREAVPIESVEVRRLGSLDDVTIERLLRDRLGCALPRRMMRLLAERTAGNPFWALEVGGALVRTGLPEHGLPVPESLSTMVSQRLAGVCRPAREALLTVAALSCPPVALAARALDGVVDDPHAAIDAAIEAGVVALSAGRLRPAHPLLGSTALDELPRPARAALHRRLANVVADPEQLARHRALAAGDGPDPVAAAALDAGAASARAKGATYAATELVELAIRFTAETDAADLARRRLEAAELLFSIGDLERAREQAAAIPRAHLPPGQYRRMLPLLAEATYWTRGRDAAHALIQRTIAESADDPRLHAVALALAAGFADGPNLFRVGLARRALAELEAAGGEPDPTAAMTALLVLASCRLDTGEGLDQHLLERAEAAERKLPWTPATNRSTVVRGCGLRVVDDLAGSRAVLRTAIHRARRDGEEGALPVLLGHLALTDCWAGRYPEAMTAAEEGLRRADPHLPATPVLHAARGLLFALTGDSTAASRLMRERLGFRSHPVDGQQVLYVLPVLGLVALLEGDSEQAVTLLGRSVAAARNVGWLDPGSRLRPEGDLGRALVDTGRLAEAKALAAELRALGERSGRPTVLGVGLRIDGLVRAAAGDLDGAVAVLDRAVAAHRRTQFPLELGRSLLALGQAHRRRRARLKARQALREAVDGFTRLGAMPFAELARAEFNRVNPARAGGALTRAEHRVAELVTAGLSNREVAARLFTSVRTVEGHLAAVYRKLGVHSRTALAHVLPVDRGGAPQRAD